eukprot:c16562_g1_i1.p1 GENE.c16562_g1_i1~~c16562_g1_i1.p1  ORF type:complete len:221 (-),score=53.56 c16562_g1_i1:101-763(-)
MGRRATWWFHMYRENLIENSIAVANALHNTNALTGVYFYPSWQGTNLAINQGGEVTQPNVDKVLQFVHGMTANGISVIATLKLATEAVLDNSARNGIPVVVQAVQSYTGVSGVMVNYEPTVQYTLQHATSFAQFLGELTQQLHQVGLGCEATVADWSILSTKYQLLYSESGVDKLQSMTPTYSCNQNTKAFVVQQLEDLKLPASQVPHFDLRAFGWKILG